MTRSLAALLLAGALALLGCSKKSDVPAGDNKTADKPTTVAPITSDDDYLARAKPMGRKLIDVFKNAGKDCDKLAAEMKKFVDDPETAAITSYELAHPGAEQKLEAQGGKELEKDFEAAASPAMESCKDNKQLMDLVAKLVAQGK